MHCKVFVLWIKDPNESLKEISQFRVKIDLESRVSPSLESENTWCIERQHVVVEAMTSWNYM